MLTPKDAILFKIVHTCANECLILTYIICPESLVPSGSGRLPLFRKIGTGQPDGTAGCVLKQSLIHFGYC